MESKDEQKNVHSKIAQEQLLRSMKKRKFERILMVRKLTKNNNMKIDFRQIFESCVLEKSGHYYG
jgi:hypothetical protein